MFYIGLLIVSVLLGAFTVKRGLRESLLKKKKRLKELEFEYAELNAEKERLVKNNLDLEKNLNEIIVLYNLTKDICKSLDEEKIFMIFKERVNNYLKTQDLRLLPKDTDLSLYPTETIFPLTIQQEALGYLAVRGIPTQDQEKFRILAQQFLIGAKRAHLYKRMQELSITDSLTGLFSRRHFLDRFKEELRRSKKFKYRFSFLMLDIDRFKTFNDQYGHLVGDAILREVAKTTKETIRQVDFVARYGGEELCVILVETDKEQARFAAERIRRAIESKAIKVYDEELRVTVSIGLAVFSDDGSTLEELIERADKALYIAKEEGRNKVSEATT